MTDSQVVPDIQIRVAVPAETEAIASVLSMAFAEFEPLYTPQAFAATTPTPEQLRTRWPEGPVWVAVAQTTIVGTVAAVIQQESVYVRSMALLPAAQGQRVGYGLLQAVEAYAVAQGCARLFLRTTPFLTQAIRLYERYGFRRTGEGPQDLFGTPLFTMEKALPSHAWNI